MTTKAKDPAKLLQWFDKFYTDDASIQNFYGSFGIGTEKDGDKYKVLPQKTVNLPMNLLGLILFVTLDLSM